MSGPATQLTAEQVEFYHREGYLVVPPIASAEEIVWLREIYDRLFASRAGREEGNQFDLGGVDEEGKEATLPQILNPAKYAPELLQAKFRSTALQIARQLLGPEAKFTFEHAILKPARIGSETPWHQDEAYWNPAMDYKAFSLWMPLQDVNLENGCMQFIPGTHKLEVQPHHSIGHDPRVHGLEIDVVDASRAVACPIPAGACTIHDSRTYHYTSPNRSDGPRRAYILSFGLTPTPRAAPRSFPWKDGKQTARQQRAERSKGSIST